MAEISKVLSFSIKTSQDTVRDYFAPMFRCFHWTKSIIALPRNVEQAKNAEHIDVQSINKQLQELKSLFEMRYDQFENCIKNASAINDKDVAKYDWQGAPNMKTFSKIIEQLDKILLHLDNEKLEKERLVNEVNLTPDISPLTEKPRLLLYPPIFPKNTIVTCQITGNLSGFLDTTAKPLQIQIEDMKRRGLSRGVIAEMLRISESTLSMIELDISKAFRMTRKDSD